MTDIPAMLLWTDAFMADTTHLTTTETGAYFLLLMTMWRAGGSLPDDDVRLARITRLPLDKWRRIAPTIREFMTVEDGVITQKRLKLELEIASSKREKAREAGIASSRAKSLKRRQSWSTTVDAKLEQNPQQCSNGTSTLPITNNQISNKTSLFDSAGEPAAPKTPRLVKPPPGDDLMAVLCPCLTEKTAKSLIEHRAAKKVKLTVAAARALVKRFEQYGDPERAVEEMMVRGWTGFSKDWMGGGSFGGLSKAPPPPIPSGHILSKRGARAG